MPLKRSPSQKGLISFKERPLYLRKVILLKSTSSVSQFYSQCSSCICRIAFRYICKRSFNTILSLVYNLIVFAVSLSLGIKNSRPVVGFEIEFGIHIDLDLNILSCLPHWVGWDSASSEKTSEKLSDS